MTKRRIIIVASYPSYQMCAVWWYRYALQVGADSSSALASGVGVVAAVLFCCFDF